MTTPRGTRINFYMLSWDVGAKKPIPGVGVQAGDRFFVAYGSYLHYGLVFWSKFDQPAEVQKAIVQKALMQHDTKKGQTVTFKGKSEPWWYMDEKTNGFGYYFHVDGTWGYTKNQLAEFPMEMTYFGGSCYELKPNGERSEKAYSELFHLTVEDHGQNALLHYQPIGHGKGYDGTGMRLSEEPIFGSWGASSNGGVGYYEFKGTQLVGVQASTDSEGRGVEILDAPADVVARNPDLWK